MVRSPLAGFRRAIGFLGLLFWTAQAVWGTHRIGCDPGILQPFRIRCNASIPCHSLRRRCSSSRMDDADVFSRNRSIHDQNRRYGTYHHHAGATKTTIRPFLMDRMAAHGGHCRVMDPLYQAYGQGKRWSFNPENRLMSLLRFPGTFAAVYFETLIQQFRVHQLITLEQ